MAMCESFMPAEHHTPHLLIASTTMSLDNPLTVLYKEVDGSKITTDLYLPSTTSASPQKYPVGGSNFIPAIEHAARCIPLSFNCTSY